MLGTRMVFREVDYAIYEVLQKLDQKENNLFYDYPDDADANENDLSE